MSADAAALFRERFGSEPRLVRSPGRVNLMGDHTDYSGGLVLPAAIDAFVELAFSPNGEELLRGYSLALDREDAVRLDALAPAAEPMWLDYAAGVAWALREMGVDVPGMDFVVVGALPMGAGLSSSAALELAVARALYALAEIPWDGRRAALAAQRAENDYVGMPCGIMDQMVVALAEPRAALLLDCRSLEVEAVPLPSGWRIVVMDTGTRRSLTTSAYAERRRDCERAAAALGITALRDATREAVEAARSRLGETVLRRARHVVDENERVVDMGRALPLEDGERVSELMASSHASLRDLFEVSTSALDWMVEIATRHPGCVGARMTGAGFGGSAVALVEASSLSDFVAKVESAYRSETGAPGALYPCRAAGGVALVS